MDKIQLKKNKLDLEYHGEAQKMNAFLILLTTGLIGFIASFIWLVNTKMFYTGVFLTFLILFIGLILYKKTSKRMKEILTEIEKLND